MMMNIEKKVKRTIMDCLNISVSCDPVVNSLEFLVWDYAWKGIRRHVTSSIRNSVFDPIWDFTSTSTKKYNE